MHMFYLRKHKCISFKNLKVLEPCLERCLEFCAMKYILDKISSVQYLRDYIPYKEGEREELPLLCHVLNSVCLEIALESISIFWVLDPLRVICDPFNSNILIYHSEGLVTSEFLPFLFLPYFLHPSWNGIANDVSHEIIFPHYKSILYSSHLTPLWWFLIPFFFFQCIWFNKWFQ